MLQDSKLFVIIVVVLLASNLGTLAYTLKTSRGITATSETLEENIESIRQDMTQLQRQLEEAIESQRKITDELQRARDNYTTLEEQVNRLAEEANRLRSKLEDIDANLASVQVSLEQAWRLLNSTLQAYEELDQMLSLQAAYHLLGSEDNVEFVLNNMAYRARDSLAEIIPHVYANRDPVPSRLMKVASFIAENIAYSPDSPTPVYLVGEGMVMAGDTLKDPFLTYAEGYGDDEDIAFLAYMLLLPSVKPDERLALVMARQGGTVVAAAVFYETGGETYYIDPTNMVVSGATLYINMSGELVNPLHLSRDVKRSLLGNVASLIVDGDIKGYQNFEAAVQAWLSMISIVPDELLVYENSSLTRVGSP